MISLGRTKKCDARPSHGQQQQHRGPTSVSLLGAADRIGVQAQLFDVLAHDPSLGGGRNIKMPAVSYEPSYAVSRESGTPPPPY